MMKEFFRPRSVRWEDWRSKVTVEWPLRFSLRAASRVVTGTASMARYYAENFNLPISRILVVPNDVDVKDFLHGTGSDPCLPIQSPTVLYVGRLDRANGADRLPLLAEEVCRRMPTARFVIIGGGPLQQSLRKEIEGMGFASRVLLVGAVPNREVAEYYVQSDVFVLPAMAEGMPRVLLECMAAGVPFVATSVGGVPDLATPLQRQWLVPPGDMKGFADRVVELLGHPEIQESLREEGLRRVRDFSRERICRLFVEQIVGMSATPQTGGDPSIPEARTETHEREAPEPARR